MERARMTALGRLNALENQNAAVADRMGAIAMRFDAMKELPKTPVVSAFNLFQTPENIADMMVRMAGIQDGMRVLEPSAGLGRIYRAIRNRSQAHVTMVEVNAECCRALFEQTSAVSDAELFQADFLDKTVGDLGTFDGIVMNPPFHRGSDVRHIRHALRFLNAGGTLVSLCFNGVAQRREFADDRRFNWMPLPKKSFASEGTNADVVLLKWRNDG